MASTKQTPAIVIVPGFWESSTAVFDETVTKLQEKGFEVIVAALRSVGHPSSDGITLNDDIAAVRGYIEALVSRGREVVVAAHSAGGFIGSGAVEGLTQKSMAQAGRSGGVIGFAFICAGLAPRGQSTGHRPFFDVQGEYVYCVKPRTSLFNDLNDQDAEVWNERMLPQPAANWDAEIRYTGHEEVPCHYLVCEQDQLLPVQLQLDFAELAKAEVVRCDAGHMVMLSQADTLFRFLAQAVEKLMALNGS